VEVPCDAAFREQRLTYAFRFACEHCAHFDDLEGACLHGFPCGPHRLGPFVSDDPPPTILFCKDFDLA